MRRIKNKKFPLVALSALLFLFMPFRFLRTAAAGNDGQHYVEEYSSREVVLPIFKTEEGQTYKVQVFEEEDKDYENPLETNGFVFTPQHLGVYSLRYLVNDNGREYYSYATLELTDTTAPAFELSLAESYSVGDTVNFMPKITDNTGHWASVSIAVTCNGEKLDGAEGGKMMLEKAGEYKVRVKVTDAGGNPTARTYSFEVTGKAEKKGCGSVSDKTAFVFAAIVLSAALIKGKKEGKNEIV